MAPMLSLSGKGKKSKGTAGASVSHHDLEMCGISGQTDPPDLTGPGGSTMSSIERWLTEVKSFETTGAGILVSFAILAFAIGMIAGIRFDRSRADTFFADGHKYRMAGLGQMQSNGETVYMMVYKEEVPR